jgi:type II secretory pathway pseudopilin PulG
MVVIAVIGVLAAVAIPVLRGYIVRSKASEAANVLQGIREKEEAYMSNFKRYTATLPWAPFDPAGCIDSTVNWDDHLPADSPWYELGFSPNGPTYYSYQVITNFQADGNIISALTPPADVCTRWPDYVQSAPSGPWYYAVAQGDIDCDNVEAHFYISSHNKTVCHWEEADPNSNLTY